MNEHKLSDKLLKKHKYGKDYDENHLKADIDDIEGKIKRQFIIQNVITL